MKTEPRALLITPVLPSTEGNGLAIRIAMFAEALGRAMPTDILCIPVFGSAGDAAWARQQGFAVHQIETAGREDTAYRLVLMLPPGPQRLAAFQQYGRSSLEARLSLPVLEDVRAFAEERHYSLVHVARGYLMRAGGAAQGGIGALTLDLDEDDAWSWRSLGRLRDPDGAAWNRAEAAAADRALSAFGTAFNALFVSGAVDGGRLARRHPGMRPMVVPNPAPVGEPAARAEDGETLLFVGSFGYAPNLDGIKWFVGEIWPLIRRARPTARLLIAGRDMPEGISELGGRNSIEALGAVDDLRPLYARAALAIAPLRAGGGTRIKLIEAAWHGVPVVATGLAARGLAFSGAEGMWTGDTAEGFAEAVLEALANPPERQRRAAQAQAVVRRHHDRAGIVEELACRFAALVGKEVNE